MKAYRGALAVLLLPAVVLVLLQAGPGLLRTSWSTSEFADKWQNHIARPAEKPPATSGATGQAQVRTKAQFHAAELTGRLKFGTASAILQVVALIAIAFALAQMASGWRTGAPRPNGAAVPAKESRVVTALAVAVTAAAIAYAYAQWPSESVRDTLLFPPIAAARQELGIVTPNLTETIQMMELRNYVIGYVAAGLLLTYLAALSIDSPAPIAEEDRLVGLQFVLAIGAALFSAAILADKASVAFTTAILDSGKASEMIKALDTLTEVWAVAYSGFLITAIGTAYFAIRGSNATVTPQVAPGQPIRDSVLAMRTPSGKDFKMLGWLVNFVIAFTPVWVTHGLAAWLKFGTAGLPQ